LRRFTSASAGSSAGSFLRLGRHVDLPSFSALLPGGRSPIGVAILAGCCGWVLFALAKVWWKSRAAGKPATTLVWAATLTWTLVVNLYVPMYDTILVVLSLIMTKGVLKDLRNESLDRGFNRIWLGLMAAYWITEQFANATGIQIVTLLLFALGMLQFAAMREVFRLQRKDPCVPSKANLHS
jgi:hypothetical protein